VLNIINYAGLVVLAVWVLIINGHVREVAVVADKARHIGLSAHVRLDVAGGIVPDDSRFDGEVNGDE
jgi:hypothetical protein